MPDDAVYRIPLNPVPSSSLFAIGYDEPKQILAVQFHGGEVFHYAGVTPDQALDLVNAPSIGRHYAQQIKGKFTGQKMTGHCPACGIMGRVGEVCPDCGTTTIADDKPKGATDGDSEGSSGAAASERDSGS